MTGLWKCSPVFLWTFHQTAPLDRLVGSSTSLRSFDLKSATDRWPLYFLFEVFQAFFDRSFASAVVNSALAFNIFEVPFASILIWGSHLILRVSSLPAEHTPSLRPDGCEPQVSLPKVLNIGPCRGCGISSPGALRPLPEPAR